MISREIYESHLNRSTSVAQVSIVTETHFTNYCIFFIIWYQNLDSIQALETNIIMLAFENSTIYDSGGDKLFQGLLSMHGLTQDIFQCEWNAFYWLCGELELWRQNIQAILE